jgi:hypothetical protein
MISQSTVTFFFLLLAFLIFIAQRGELGAYLALLYGGGTPTPQPATGGGATPPPANAASNATQQTLSTIAPYALDVLGA